MSGPATRRTRYAVDLEKPVIYRSRDLLSPAICVAIDTLRPTGELSGTLNQCPIRYSLTVPSSCIAQQTDMSDETPFSRFVQLVYEACQASEAVDYFDLRSDGNETHELAWEWLCAEQDRVFLALVEHVRANADMIVAGIGPVQERLEPPAKLPWLRELAQARHTFLVRYAKAAEKGQEPNLNVFYALPRKR